MRLSRRAGAVGACACAVAMMMSMAAPAQAAVTGWRQFFRHHYGAPGNFSGYRAVVAPGKSDAWAFGGTALSGGTAPFGTPVAEHWNGRAWRGSPRPARRHDSINAAGASSASALAGVDQLRGCVLHWT